MHGFVYLETHRGDYMTVTRPMINQMSRAELERHLEDRGFAVYDDESTDLLRDTALEDFDAHNPY